MKSAIVNCFAACCVLSASASPLYERGYIVMPEPQKAQLGAGDFRFGPGWRLELGPGVAPGSAAVAALNEDLESRFHLRVGGEQTGAGVLRLTIAAGSVPVGATQDRDKKAIAAQAYKIDLTRDSVSVTANAEPGLFYGVETFVQLLKPRSGSALAA